MQNGNQKPNQYPLSHTHTMITTDAGQTWREMRDIEATDNYVRKLSYAAIVRQTFATGEWLEFECGVVIGKGF